MDRVTLMSMQAGARAEWDHLRHVMVHEPGIEVFFALLSPASHLYERFFNRTEAEREHKNLSDLLKNTFHVRVDYLSDVILEAAESDPQMHQALVLLAQERLKRICSVKAERLPPRLRTDLLSPVSLEERDAEHLLEIVILDPLLSISPSRVEVRLQHTLHNLYFMRDQQAATDRGMVLSRMATPERAGEVALSRLALQALDLPIACQVEHGTFEGGDFMPAGEFALIGCGPRTSRQGVEDLLACGLSYDEVAVVYEPRHPLIGGWDPMVAMHLDTYFNLASPGIAVGSPLLLSKANVEVYRRDDESYRLERSGISLQEY
ncbi:MAG TPA: arginine deiminase family protein, partial [Methanomicrobiales archaeon]|nr:arginine deiminase family protein [Methanomicrobiales archaeon]